MSGQALTRAGRALFHAAPHFYSLTSEPNFLDMPDRLTNGFEPGPAGAEGQRVGGQAAQEDGAGHDPGTGRVHAGTKL